MAAGRVIEKGAEAEGCVVAADSIAFESAITACSVVRACAVASQSEASRSEVVGAGRASGVADQGAESEGDVVGGSRIRSGTEAESDIVQAGAIGLKGAAAESDIVASGNRPAS